MRHTLAALGTGAITLFALGCSRVEPAVPAAERLAAADPVAAAGLAPGRAPLVADGPNFRQAVAAPLSASIESGEKPRLRVSTAGAGALALSLPVAGPAHLDAGRLVYAHAARATQAIVTTQPERVEVFFLLADASAPSSFDLDLETKLDVTEDAGGLRFVNRHNGEALRMPAPFALDANGSRRPVRLSLEAGRVRLALDTAGLAFPVLVDPAIETAVWLQVHGPPPERAAASLAFDPVANRVLMFGGVQNLSTKTSNQPVYFGDTWSWDGTTWKDLRVAGPSLRAFAAMATDTTSRRVVICGGTSGGAAPLGDCWEWSGAAWKPQVAAAFPTARERACMAYDAGRGRLVLYGGLSGTTYLGDVWEFDGTTWSKITPTGTKNPNPRGEAGCFYDATQQRFTIVGGYSSSGGRQSDAWSWNGTAWTQLAISNFGSHRTVAAWDAGRNLAVIAGTEDNSVYEWVPGGAATRTSVFGKNVVYPALTWDSARSQAVLFGGAESIDKNEYDWTWTGAAGTWTLRAGNGPPNRRDQAMAADSATGKVFLLSGNDGSNDLGDFWTWNGTAWTQGPTDPALVRRDHAMVWDSLRNRVVMFGGQKGSTELADTWEFDGTAWAKKATTGPSARARHAMAFDASRGRVVLFGGMRTTCTTDCSTSPCTTTCSTSTFGDTWEWDGTTWTRKATSGPANRRSHAMAFDAKRNRTLLFGGSSGGNETWAWDGATWTRLATTGPQSRFDHALAYDPQRDRALLFGGDGGNDLGDTWEFDGAAWNLTATTGPSPRKRMAMAFDGSRGRLVLFGGDEGTRATFGDTWEYHLRANACTSGAQCDTKSCVDGVCCEQAACGACQACNTAGAPGVCAAVTVPDPDSCPGTCGATGCTLLANGAACTSGTGCTSGQCVDGVCCDTACAGACDACSVAAGAAQDGTCSFVTQRTCRPAAGACDVAEACAGTGADCPPDLGAPDGTPCTSTQICLKGICAALPEAPAPTKPACAPPPLPSSPEVQP